MVFPDRHTASKEWIDDVAGILEALEDAAGLKQKIDQRRIEGLSEIVRGTSKLPLAQMRGEIVDRVAAWRNGAADDDISLVLVEAQ